MTLLLIGSLACSILLIHQSMGWFVSCIALGIILYRRTGLKPLIIGLTCGIVLYLSAYLYNAASNIAVDNIQGMVVYTGKNFFLVYHRFQTIYVKAKLHTYQCGDYLFIQGRPMTIDFPHLEQAFNFTDFLHNKNVWIELTQPRIVEKWLFPLRISSIKTAFLKHFSLRQQEWVSLLLFGETLETNATDVVKRLHIIYLFSVSGIHLHLWLTMITKILQLWMKEKFAILIGYLTLLPLWMMNITSIVFVRIFGMYIIKSINEYFFNNRFSHLECIVGLAMLVVTMNPFIVHELGFLLGFGLSIYQSLIHPLIMHSKKKWHLWVRSALMMLMLIPYYLVETYTVPWLSLFIIPLLTPLIATFFVIVYFSFLGFPLIKPIAYMIELLEFMLNKLETLSMAFVIGKLAIPFIVIMIFFILIYLYARQIKAKHWSNLILGLLFLSCLSTQGYYRYIAPDFIAFINVGQGDSILIKNGQFTMLIDTGGSLYTNIAEEVLIPYFHLHSIDTIDALVITHDDYDHAGAVDALINHFHVKQRLYKKDFPYQMGDLKFQSLNPNDGADENESSIVLMTTFLSATWLFMGDAPISIESIIMNTYPMLDVDYIKIGHHGSNTSTSEAFIERITPKEAIISCGENNIYHHPHTSVLSILEEQNVRVRRTDIEGTILYVAK